MRWCTAILSCMLGLACVNGQEKSVLIKGIPHVKQKPDFCGEACTEMVLRKLGCKGGTQDYVFNQAGLPPDKGRGCYTKELRVALLRIGFRMGPVGTWVSAKVTSKELEAEWLKLYSDLERGIPSITCGRYSDRPKTTEHFRLVIGYDAKTKEVIYHEPAVKDGAFRRMKKSTYLQLWPLKYKASKWLLIRFALDPQKVPEQVETDGLTNADYVQEIMRIKKMMPEGFHMLLQKPFIVVGDEDPARVKRRAVRTVAWATAHLKKQYFKNDPKRVITIWLFKDKPSYKKHAWDLFQDRPDTPYGYFSHTHNALIMNIATGGGTLVHEMVHPFVDTNFPECPSWFNEGLASLYEQCGERGGKIVGFTNWRLRGLQSAIKKGRVPSFKTLTSTTTIQFYNHDPGTNYSQARYLCYYLQQKGLLLTYYHEFAKNAKNDPTGYKTLQKVLKTNDMAAFKKDWEKWVSELVY